MITIQTIPTVDKGGVDIPHCASLRMIPQIMPEMGGALLYPIIEVIGEDGSTIARIPLTQSITVAFKHKRARQIRVASDSPVISIASLGLATSSEWDDRFSGLDQIIAGERYLGIVGAGSALGCAVVTRPTAYQATTNATGGAISVSTNAPAINGFGRQPQFMVMTLENLGPNDILLDPAPSGDETGLTLNEAYTYHVRPGEIWNDQVDISQGGPFIVSLVADQIAPFDCRVGWRI